MTSKSIPLASSAAVAIFATLLCCVPSTAAQTYQVLYNFGGPGGVINTFVGAIPFSGVVFDHDGNLYGTTASGGIPSSFNNCDSYPGCGTVFELTPNQGGPWRAKFIHFFQGSDGANPTSPLMFDSQGNLYGTSNCPRDCASLLGGVVYQLSPDSGSNWTFSVLYGFGEAGCNGYGTCSVAFDPFGHLYGSEILGFSDCFASAGEIIALDQAALSSWYRLVVHCFDGGTGGGDPTGTLAFDGQGSIYGVTIGGGSSGVGTVYKIARKPGSPRWTETVLYSFQGGSDGANPEAGVAFDSMGNLYGTTSQGGSANMGTVYKLTPQSNGTWTESVLYSFQGSGDASAPNSTLSFDTAGDLYGTAAGGAHGHGAVFKLTPSPGGQWTETLEYSFTGGLDGDTPSGGVTLDASGNLYGTTQMGGIYGQNGGVAFEITP